MRTHKAYLGLLGLVLLLTGQAIYFLLPDESFLLFAIHTALGTVCVVGFLFSGGISLLREQSSEKQFKRRRNAFIQAAILLIAVAVSGMVLKRHELFEYDSTFQKVFSLAPETTEILKNLPGKLTIRAFFLGGVISDSKVRKLLEQFEDKGVQIVMIDPEKDLTSLERFGITQAESLHFTLHMPSGEDRTAKIAHVAGEDDLDRILKKLIRSGSRLVLFTKGHGEPSIDDKSEAGYLFFKEALEGENLNIQGVSLSSIPKIPDDARLLIVAAPKEEFPAEERKIVADYIAKGGSVVLFQEPRASREAALLARLFGIEIGQGVIVELLPGGQGLGVQPRISDFSKMSSITRGFTRSVLFTTASSVKRAPGADERAVQELGFTGMSGWEETNLELLFSSAPQAAKDLGDTPGPVPVAAANDGSIGVQRFKGRAVAFGDADFVSNLHLRELANRDFVLNAVNWALGEEVSPGARARSLTLTTERLSSEQLSKLFLFGAIILPEIFALFGLYLAYRRSR